MVGAPTATGVRAEGCYAGGVLWASRVCQAEPSPVELVTQLIS